MLRARGKHVFSSHTALNLSGLVIMHNVRLENFPTFTIA
jgi:hypothetical protein